ncbi:MAG: ATP-dependent helicase, partial [Planctomycetota bacterium]
LRWILVDEYQDTNSVQYAILKHLTSGDRNVCATGDPDQSIYRWRGATIRNILDFERDFPGARVVTLDRNYRSTRSILAVADSVIRRNRGRRPKELRTDNPAGAPVDEVRCRDDQDEAETLRRRVRAWRAAGRRGADVAVFYRTNAQSRVIERALAEAGIPYRILGAVEFYKRREIKDLMAYLRVGRNPRDEVAFLRVLNVPPRGVGARTEERLLGLARERSVAPRELLRDRGALAGLGRAHGSVERFAELLDRIEALPADRPGACLRGVVEATGYRSFLGEGTPAAEVDRLENVDELLNAALEYERREPEGGTDGFLEEVALVSDQDDYDAAADAVTLMTVHSAKGLEFPCVVVAGLEERLFPHALSLDEPEEVEEERRLFYVAATRAREELVLLHAAYRTRYGAPEPGRRSRFLDEVPPALVRRQDRLAAGEADGWGGEAVFEREGPTYAVGDRVEHDHFGAGRVAQVRRRGEGTRIIVEFDRAGRRELLLSYARLRRL